MTNLLRLLIGIAILLPASTLKAQSSVSSDPFIGSWAHGVRYRSSTWYANGATSFSHYTAKYDEREVLVQGSNGFLLPVSLKRIATDTVVATYKRGMQPVATSRREVSADGQVMTITTTVIGKDGKIVTTIGVYDKSTQPSALSIQP